MKRAKTSPSGKNISGYRTNSAVILSIAASHSFSKRYLVMYCWTAAHFMQARRPFNARYLRHEDEPEMPAPWSKNGVR